MHTEQVGTFLRSLGTAECFQSAGDQVLQLGVDDSVFLEGRFKNNQLDDKKGRSDVERQKDDNFFLVWKTRSVTGPDSVSFFVFDVRTHVLIQNVQWGIVHVRRVI